MTSAGGDSKDLESFLSRVDEISDIINGLTQSDDKSTEKAVERADALIEKAENSDKKNGFNRTVVNKTAFRDESAEKNVGPVITDDMSQEAFCAAIERDAAERSARRKEKLIVANKFKESGNALFKLGKFEEAVDAYTRGLAEIRDFKELYTNRAQAYIKLGRYQDAIEDCDWALKVQAKNAKALVLQGRAHLALHEYDKAIEKYNQALQCEPQQATTIQAYVNEAELAKASAEQERLAAQRLAAGAKPQVTVVEAIKRIKENGHAPAYYHAALSVLYDLIVDEECKSLFRIEEGFEMIFNHDTIAKCACSEKLSPQEAATFGCFLAVITKVCDHNEASQVKFLSMAAGRNMIARFLTTPSLRTLSSTQIAVYRLLLSCCTSEAGTNKLISELNCMSLLDSTLTMLTERSLQPLSSSTSVEDGRSLEACGIELLETLARHDRFKKKITSWAERNQNIYLFKTLLLSCSVQKPTMSIMTNLCSEPAFRRAFANNKDILEAVISTLPNHEDGLMRTPDLATAAEKADLALGLLLNVTLVCGTAATAAAVDDVAEALCLWCLRTCVRGIYEGELSADERESVASVVQRSFALVGRLLRPRADLTETLLRAVSVKAVATALSSLLISTAGRGSLEAAGLARAAISSLACFTSHSDSVRREILADRTALSSLLGHLSCGDEQAVGNAALCLAQCLTVQPAANTASALRAAAASPASVLKVLLPQVRDAKKDDVRQNCAILVARLTQLDTEYLEELRRLEGLGILHSCMKLIQ